MDLQVTDAVSGSNVIYLTTGYGSETKEAYRIDVSKERVVVDGASEDGLFYGVQTVRKAIPVVSKGGRVVLPGVEICDYPRFGYRGMHFDTARHYFPVEFIKRYLDIMALHNINTFHWHLTDDQGWRIEIKSWPLLTELGSVRKETLVGHNRDEPQVFDGTPYGGFYTQDEIREVVAYAADRHIDVIPEIDLPGHMLAAMHAYPELGCTGGPYEVATKWGVFEDVLCPGNERTFEFLEDVFDEITELFPYEYIHIGGDECPKTRWENCPRCQARIKAENINGDERHTAEQALQSYCMSRMEKYLNGKGRTIICWDEILEGTVVPNAVIMSWRGVEGGREAARLEHDVIMAPFRYLYFDYAQSDGPGEPLSMKALVPLEKVYRFEPVPEGLTDGQKDHIMGVQANMWAEYLTGGEKVEYMLMPRIDALSEIQWLETGKKNYERFTARLERMAKLYDLYGYTYAKHVFDEG